MYESVVPEIIKIIVDRLALDEDYESLQRQLATKLISELSLKSEEICSRLTALRVEYHISKSFSAKNLKSKNEIESALQIVTTGLDADEIFLQIETELKTIIDTNDYVGLLSKYPTKGLHRFANSILGIKDYQDFVIRLIAQEPSLVDAIMKYLPSVPTE